MEDARTMVDADIMETHPVNAAEEDAGHKTTGIGVEAAAVTPTVISHITFGHTECVPIQEKIAGHHRMSSRRTHYGVIRCQEVRETAPDRSGR